MLAKGFGLLEHADVQLSALGLCELRKLDRAGEAGRPSTHDHHIQLHPVARTFGAV